MASLMNLTVCGFGPFERVEVNPSETLIHNINIRCDYRQQFELSTHVFSVAYKNAKERIETVIDDTQPDIFFMIGVNQNAQTLQLEKIAKNIDNCATPDNQGTTHVEQAILTEDAPQSYVSDLPLEDMITRLNADHPIATISEDAGGYICNHYYFMANWILNTRQSHCKCLFIHIPMLPSTHQGFAMSIDVVAQSILTIANMIADTATQQTT